MSSASCATATAAAIEGESPIAGDHQDVNADDASFAVCLDREAHQRGYITVKDLAAFRRQLIAHAKRASIERQESCGS